MAAKAKSTASRQFARCAWGQSAQDVFDLATKEEKLLGEIRDILKTRS